MSAIVTICARGGSKGVPRKNVRKMMGKPLIVYSIEQALSCDFVNGVYVSTDDEEIAQVAQDAGAHIPFLRPAELADDATGKLDVIKHLTEHLSAEGVMFETIIDLDPTSPLRSITDIRLCYELLTTDCDAVITGYLADKNPYFNMVELSRTGMAQLVKSPSEPTLSRQSAPAVYSMNASIYVWHKQSLQKGLWEGRTRLHVMPIERSVDIDSPLDWKLVELLMSEAQNQS